MKEIGRFQRGTANKAAINIRLGKQLGGIGRITEQAVSNQDAAVLQAIVILAALGFVIINLAIDLIYPLLDPRLGKTVSVTA